MDRLEYANKREFCALELENLFPHRTVPDALYKATLDYPTTCALPDTIQAEIRVQEPVSGPSDEEITQGELDAENGVDVRVVLLNLSKVPSRFTKFWCKMIVTSTTKTAATSIGLYGGNHNAAKDGEDTSSLQTLVNTAVRHLKAQCGLDFSALPLSCWKRFATYHQKSNPSASPVAPTTVQLIPFYWEHMSEPADVTALSYRTTTTVVKTVKKTVEETIEKEVEVEREAPDQEGVTEDEKVMEKVKEIQTETVEKEVEVEEEEEQEEVITPSYPMEISVHAMSRKKRDSTPTGYASDFLADWISFRYGARIASAITKLNGKRQEILDKKRKREEAVVSAKRRKQEKQADRKSSLEQRLADMQQAWKEDDEGKTHDELKEALSQRAQEKKDVQAEFEKQWAEEDANDTEMAVPEEPEEVAAKPPTDGEVDIDQKLLQAASVFDPAVQSLGSLPSETMSTDVLRRIVASFGPVRCDSAVTTFMEDTLDKDALQRQSFKYRSLTDQY
eukprot:TRINITY_DN50418_c0_g1_i1.p1 TRINITY_DN50418_c0_g1~~TRINITY_DN50418_c0_g1_i1.p1  ORF type:complete len:505 (+),score=216.87 TRINITY_DN50418_c0_g1_i1:42-1556(+)